jgi:hypothetical protein
LTMTLAEFLKDYGAPIAWIVAAVGWFISSKQADSREKRKEFRAEIESIEKLVKELLAKLATHYRVTKLESLEPSLTLEIKVLFHELTLKWERIKKRQSGGTLGLFLDPCASQLESFFDRSTGDFFESADTIQSEKVSELILEIHIDAHLFIEALHSLFLKKFDSI